MPVDQKTQRALSRMTGSDFGSTPHCRACGHLFTHHRQSNARLYAKAQAEGGLLCIDCRQLRQDAIEHPRALLRRLRNL